MLISIPGTKVIESSFAFFSASSSPFIVSWSVSAITERPLLYAFSINSEGEY